LYYYLLLHWSHTCTTFAVAHYFVLSARTTSFHWFLPTLLVTQSYCGEVCHHSKALKKRCHLWYSLVRGAYNKSIVMNRIRNNSITTLQLKGGVQYLKDTVYRMPSLRHRYTHIHLATHLFSFTNPDRIPHKQCPLQITLSFSMESNALSSNRQRIMK
jgi:hypothetical protein